MRNNLYSYSHDEIIHIIGGELIKACSTPDPVNKILTDSRNLTNASGTVFFALKTKRNDGHKYVEELCEKGIKNFVVSSLTDLNVKECDAHIFLVKNTLKALQKLCAAHRQKYNLEVIGITGSNGKTIVKEWLFQLLSPDKKIVRSPKSFNSQIGVPLSVWQINEKDELGIFEAGISEPDEMESLKNIILPTYGIFTNIGSAHDENFINIKQKVGEKLKLFTKVSMLIYCSDYADIHEIIIKSGLSKNIKLFTWSYKNKAGLFIKSITKGTSNTTIKGVYDGKEKEIQIPFNDDASVENAIHCWCYMLLQAYNDDICIERFSHLTPVAMRLELKEGINNCTIINDSYNSDINSLTIALDFLKEQRQHPKRTLILSDIQQSGKSGNELYEEVSGLVAAKQVGRIIGIGKAISRQANKFTLDKMFYESTEDFISHFPFSELRNEAILLKGAREFEFEKIISYLQQKTHKTTLEINLNAIIHNLNYYKSLLNSDVKLMVMVKAFSYGNGSYEIANVLQFNQVNYLGVAFTDEGKELRKAGITLPIMVMNADESTFDDIITYNLEPEIFSLRTLELFQNVVKKNKYAGKYPIHIKLDTGMHRLGFCSNDTDVLIEKLTGSEHLRVVSVFTHLASSNNEAHDLFTLKQIEIYEKTCDKLKAGLKYNFLMHILNTAGIKKFPLKQFDMVRLGLGLYGIASTKEEQESLENVSVLRTTISQIKHIKKGETVGYDRSFTALKNMTIATVPIGYADGLSRRLGNKKGKMKIQNIYAPIIGNICMDMCMLDITGIDTHEGDEVIVFDKDYSVVNMSLDVETIPYEILTGFSRRVKRVYFKE